MRESVAAWLKDWAEPIAYGVVGAAILLLMNRMGFLAGPLGWLLAAAAAFLLWRLFRSAYLDRMLHKDRSDGPGVVEIDERRVAYFGPETGGVVSIDSLTRVEIHTTDDGPLKEDMFWAFYAEDPTEPRLLVPNGALGADRLLNALSALSGFDHEAVIRAMGSTADARFVLWTRAARGALENAETERPGLG